MSWCIVASTNWSIIHQKTTQPEKTSRSWNGSLISIFLFVICLIQEIRITLNKEAVRPTGFIWLIVLWLYVVADTAAAATFVAVARFWITGSVSGDIRRRFALFGPMGVLHRICGIYKNV